MINKLFLIICLNFHTAQDDTSSYISFISDMPRQTFIRSYNISNSTDPYLKVRNYELKLTGNDSTATGHVDTPCREIATQKITPIPIGFTFPPLYLYLHEIELKHSHTTYEKFVNLCGKREVWIKEKKVGEHTFIPREFVGTTDSSLTLDDSSVTDEGCLYLTLQGENRYMDRMFDQHFPVAPVTKYRISFYFLIPKGSSPATDYAFEVHDCEDTRYYKRPTKERKYSLRGNYYWKRVDKYITTSDKTTDLRILFKLDNDSDDLGDLIVRDFKLRRFSAVNKGP